MNLREAPIRKIKEVIKNKGEYSDDSKLCGMTCYLCEISAYTASEKYDLAIAAYIKRYGEAALFELLL